LPAAVLRTTLGLVLIGAGLGLLTTAGVGVPGVAIAAFPLAVAALVVGVLVRDRQGRGSAAVREAAGQLTRSARARPQPSRSPSGARGH
jgi:hypothetical protein